MWKERRVVSGLFGNCDGRTNDGASCIGQSVATSTILNASSAIGVGEATRVGAGDGGAVVEVVDTVHVEDDGLGHRGGAGFTGDERAVVVDGDANFRATNVELVTLNGEGRDARNGGPRRKNPRDGDVTTSDEGVIDGKFGSITRAKMNLITTERATRSTKSHQLAIGLEVGFEEGLV